MEFLEAMASIRALNDTLFLHVHRGVTAAQVRGGFGFIRISNRRRNSLAVVKPLSSRESLIADHETDHRQFSFRFFMNK